MGELTFEPIQVSSRCCLLLVMLVIGCNGTTRIDAMSDPSAFLDFKSGFTDFSLESVFTLSQMLKERVIWGRF